MLLKIIILLIGLKQGVFTTHDWGKIMIFVVNDIAKSGQNVCVPVIMLILLSTNF